MGLIVKETAILANTGGATITEFEVLARPFSGLFISQGVCKIKPEVGAYIDSATAFNDLTNNLNLVDFPKRWEFEYKYGVDDTNLLYWVDVQIKEVLLATYPDWKSENIIITSELPIE